MIKKYIIVILLMYGNLLWGQQPVTTRLGHNPVLSDYPVRMERKQAVPDTLDLPFIDDFSYYTRSVYPDQSLWTDCYVFINNNFPDQPRSNGVATFDALDAEGQLYVNSAVHFPADTLTSRPINLGESGTRDVYLSFFYQPQGKGDSPEEGDSLILQFKLPEPGAWKSVWNTPGTTLHPFKQVMIPVEEQYLYKGFQFRFVNMVSLDQDDFNPGKKGNADHWHIDYVRLDKNRHENDTAMFDVAAISPVKSLIKGYQSIPWSHFPYAFTTRLEPMMEFAYRNNDNQGHNPTRVFEIRDVYHSNTIPVHRSAENIGPGEIETFKADVLNHFISASVDSALFELKAYLDTDALDRRENDTAYFYQNFSNYFARDDGIPESGYGYSGINAQNCAIACRYEMFMPDSLQAISIYFNPSENNITSRYSFQIAVWRDNNGQPGEQIYLSREEYSPGETGKFTTYLLDQPVYITKYYWIGWQQVTTGFLNVGFDHSFNDRGNLWYNSPGSWQPDHNNGTLMVRPFVGKRSNFLTSVPLPEVAVTTNIKIYPNPASQYIYVEAENIPDIVRSDYIFEIYDSTGRLKHRGIYPENPVDVSRFPQGMYIVRLVNRKTGQAHTQKVLISR